MSLKEALYFVAPGVREAAVNTSAELERLGIRHALAGGLAVGAYGYVRNTVNVYFLVGAEAFEQHGALVTFKAGVPIEAGGIQIDYLSPAGLGPHMEDVFANAPISDGIPVVPVDVLIYMKLAANRRRDQLDIIELIRAGADSNLARGYLERYAADLIPRFEVLLKEAIE